MRTGKRRMVLRRLTDLRPRDAAVAVRSAGHTGPPAVGFREGSQGEFRVAPMRAALWSDTTMPARRGASNGVLATLQTVRAGPA